MNKARNFALIGAAGFIAPRHMKAIMDTGNRLVAITDPHDAVGTVDRYFPEAKYFREIERFDRFLEKARRQGDEQRVHYISVCSPNFLHDAHTRLGLRVRANVICEKPLVIKPWNLDPLLDVEAETGARVYTILQLRLHPALQALREQLAATRRRDAVEVVLTYVTRRGAWYHASWKGDEARSGGLLTNIGIHFFDVLVWLFGTPVRGEVHLRTPERVAGLLELERARVRWFLSIDRGDLPVAALESGKHAYRSLTLDGAEFEFSEGFADLHTLAYHDVLAGGGFGIADARPSIELVQGLRVADVTTPGPAEAHPLLER